jgi:hypothetical protein
MRAITISAGATARAAAVISSWLTSAITSAPAAANTRANVPNASAVSRRGQSGLRIPSGISSDRPGCSRTGSDIF